MTNPASSSRDAPDNGSNTAMTVKTEAKAKIMATAKEGARAVESRAQSMAALGIAQAEEHLRGLSRALESTRSELDEQDHPFAGAFGSIHDRVDSVARGLADRDPSELMEETEHFARRNPWLFIGGCFVGGIVLARFLKASDPEPRRTRREVPEPDMMPRGALGQQTDTFDSTTEPGGYEARGERHE